MDTLSDAVYLLIERYVQRQQLPLDVMRKYRPFLFDSTKRRPGREYASATAVGYWGDDNEWKYFLHGGGCRLTHTITGETIDWNATDPNRFDKYWFTNWLMWYLKQNVFFRPSEEEEAVSIITSLITEQRERAFREGIFAVLEQLAQEGKLLYSLNPPNCYKLTV